jgi:hypothetical protein
MKALDSGTILVQRTQQRRAGAHPLTVQDWFDEHSQDSERIFALP